MCKNYFYCFRKKNIFVIVFIFFIIHKLISTENSTSFTITSSGILKVNPISKAEIKFVPTGATTDWKFAFAIKDKSEQVKNNHSYFTLFTPPQVKGKLNFSYNEKGMECNWTFKALDDVSFNTLAIEFKLPINCFMNYKWIADAKEGVFPEKYEDSGLFGSAVRKFSIFSETGVCLITLEFPEAIHLGIEDDRKWGSQNYKIRFGKVFGKLAKNEEYRITMRIMVPSKINFLHDDEVKITFSNEWIVLKPDMDIKAGSALDLSMNEFAKGPCGKEGRIIVTKDGHFVFANDPQKKTQRFYGVNLCFTAQYMKKEETDLLLDRLVKLGYNSVRIHHYEFRLTDPPWKTGFDWNPKYLDQLHYLIAGCSRRGLWITTDLYVSRPISPEQIGVPAEKPYINNNRLVDPQVYKLLILIHEPAYQDFITFARKLLESVNPYTGKKLAEEPALAWINLINEGAPGNKIKDFSEWKCAWNKWLVDRYPDRNLLTDAIGTLNNEEDPELGTIEFPKGGIDEDTPRGRLCRTFLADVEQKFITRVCSFLREQINCNALISNHNCPPNYLFDQKTRENLDYVDDHFYVDHPIFERGWGLPSRSPNTNPILSKASGANRSASIRLWGKPMTISEFNYCAPGQFRGIGALLTGAIASLQDWDALWRFAYAHTDKEIFTPMPIDYFNLARDPLALASDRVAIMLFLRRDLKPAQNSIARIISEKEIFLPSSNITFNTNDFAWFLRIGDSINFIPDNSISIPLSFNHCEALEKIRKAGIKIDFSNKVISSESEEIMIDSEKGILCIDTPRTFAVYSAKDEEISAKKSGVAIGELTTETTIFITSLDSKPIYNSSRLLVTHLTDLQNNGIEYSDSSRQTLTNWGGLPYLVRNGEAKIRINFVNPNKYVVWRISQGGKRLSKVQTKIEGSTLSFKASINSPFGAIMLYELTTDNVGADSEADKFRISKLAEEHLLSFDKPFLFDYKAWKDKTGVEDSKVFIRADKSQGGAGYNFNNGLDFTNIVNKIPVLYLKIGKDNMADSIKVLFLDDKSSECSYIYNLSGKNIEKEIRLLPENNTSFIELAEKNKFNISIIKQIQILGNWSEQPIDISLSRLVLE